jgi:hypothetical protein
MGNLPICNIGIDEVCITRLGDFLRLVKEAKEKENTIFADKKEV